MSDDPIIRLNAALEGRYRIESELGEGGMATVYLADDLKHERKVALKVLKPELAAVVGAERFLAEIKTTANLTHPNILPLFDSGEADGFLFYVMPYVEGETLRDRLDRDHQLPVDDAVQIAKDVAEALDYAHGHGVIHRDIKPANILMQAGKPVISDFGIALAVGTAGQGRLTETGLSMGTPHYMSPEQATGDLSVGAATDVYALGCVLYEMLVGEPPYTGSTAQAILGKIIAGKLASATEARASVPANVDAAIRKSLEKVPADRFTGAQDFARALADPGFKHGESVSVGVAAVAGAWSRLSLMTTGIAAFLGLGLGWALARPTPSADPAVPTRVAIETLSDDIAVSRDGRWFVKVDSPEGAESALYIRAADDPEWRRLSNTEGARTPAFSPDGQWLAFRVGGSGIWKVPVTGGVRLPIVSGGGGDPHWALPDTIVYSTLTGQIYLVGASGENPQLLFESDSIVATRPHLLPNGEGVLFSTITRGGPSASRILLLELVSGRVRELVPSGTDPHYVPTGHIIYGHFEQALRGVPFDIESLEVTGTPITLLPELAVGPVPAGFAVSETGTLLYEASPLSGDLERVLVEVDLEGVERSLSIRFSRLHEPRYSPDGLKIVYGDQTDIRIYDLVSGDNRPFATGYEPKWSMNGDFIYFTVLPQGMRRRRTDFGAEVEELTDGDPIRYVTDAAPGDSVIVVRERSEERGWDLRLMRLGAGGPEFEDFLTADWNEVNADVSPDGNWVAYQADEGGVNRILVRSFPVIGPPYLISPDGGIDPLWSPDGGTIYYSIGSRFMAVDVATEPTFSASPPRLMFDEPSYVTLDPRGTDNNWHIHPDGDRFLLVKSPRAGGVDGEEAARMFIVTNWFTELRERMGNN